MSNPNVATYATLEAKDLKALITKAAVYGKKAGRRARERVGESRKDNPDRKPRDERITPEVLEAIRVGEQFQRDRSGRAWAELAILRNPRNDQRLLKQQERFTWDQRWAVVFKRIPSDQPPISKVELAAFIGGSPVQGGLAAAGLEPTIYNPAYTAPDDIVWKMACAGLSSEWHVVLLEIGLWVFAPPLLGNMAKRHRANAQKKKLTDEAIALTKRVWTYTVPEATVFAMGAVTQPAEKAGIPDFVRQIANEIAGWLLLTGVKGDEGRVIVLQNTSPGMPYAQSKPPTGEKGWGRAHSPQFLADFATPHGEKGGAGVLPRFCELLVNATIRARSAIRGEIAAKGVRWLHRELMKKGQEFYKELMKNDVMTRDAGFSDALSLKTHHVWKVAAGNVKPILVEEIALKPDRYINSSPALLRATQAKFAKLCTMHATASTVMVGHSWVNGGSRRFFLKLLERVVKIGGKRRVFAVSAPDELRPRGDLAGIEVEGVVWYFWDVKAMDLHNQGEHMEMLGDQCLGMLPELDDLRINSLAFLAGHSVASNARPVVMWPNDVVSRPEGENPSGSQFTYVRNQIKSNGVIANLGEKLKADPSVEYPGPGGSLRHTRVLGVVGDAWGDDMLVGIVLDTAKYDDVMGEVTQVEAYPSTLTKDTGGRKVDWKPLWASLDKKIGREKSGLCGKLATEHGLNWKDTTMGMETSLSARAFLGGHLCALVSQASALPSSELSPEAPLLAVRPPAKVLFSVFWPRHVIPRKSVLKPAVVTAFRCVAGALEAAAAYPVLHSVFEGAYNESVRAAGVVDWDNTEIQNGLESALSDIHRYGEASPLALQGEGWRIGSFPTREFCYELATGEQVPDEWSTEDLPGSLEPISLEDLGVLVSAPELGPDKAREPKPSSPKEDEIDLGDL